VTLTLLLLAAALAGDPDATGARADSLPVRLRPESVVVARGDGRGEVLEPAGVAIDAFGRLYVSDAALHRIQRFDERGAFLGTAGSLGSDPGQLRRPAAVALLGALSLAVLDVENRRVQAYDLFGRQLGTLIDLRDPALLSAVSRVDPVAMAADRGGALYIADADRDRVLLFDFAGRFVRAIGGIGTRPGSFRGLAGLALAPRGELVTAERVNARVQRLDAGGRAVAAWPIAARAGRGALPVAVDDSSRVAVADELTGELWLFDATGRPLGRLAGLEGPRALAFARDGALLVCEARAGRVRRILLEPRAAAPGE
jgi:DNA-binding beta-propeller fold protein YncE